MSLTSIVRVCLALGIALWGTAIAVGVVSGGVRGWGGPLGPIGGLLMTHAIVAAVMLGVRARGRARRLMNGGLVLTLMSFAAWIVMLQPGPTAEVSGRIAMLLGGWSVIVMIVGVVLLQPANRGSARWARAATLALAAALLVAWGLDVAVRPTWDEPWFERAITVIAILMMCGLLASLAIARLRVDDDERTETVGVTCPRCGVRGRLRVGGDLCGQCRLRITVKVP